MISRARPRAPARKEMSVRGQSSPSDEFPGFLSCNEEHTTPVGEQYPDQEVTRSHSVLQSQDGAAYVNSSF